MFDQFGAIIEAAAAGLGAALVPSFLVAKELACGALVPVIDLRVRFGLTKSISTPRTKWIVVKRGELSFALVVDAVTEVFRSGEVKPAPMLHEGADVRALDGVTSHDGDMVFILDIGRLADLVDPKLAEQVEEVASRTSPPRRLG